MKGLRKIQRAKPPRTRPGLDDPAHLARVRQMECLLKGRRGVIRKWVGIYPHSQEAEIGVQHVCSDSRSDAHHTTRKSQRGSDLTCIPVCRAGHDLIHSLGQSEVERIFDIDLRAEARRLAK